MKRTSQTKRLTRYSVVRHRIVVASLMVGMIVLTGQAYKIQILDSTRLQAEGAARQLRNIVVKPARGRILDRNGDVLAVSTPLDAIWAHPATLFQAREDWPRLAEALDFSPNRLANILERAKGREFVYLRRHLPPAEASRIESLAIPGVSSQREYGRYYPAGPITSHVLGFTDVDDRGQEGIEKAFDSHLSGVDGQKRVLRDNKGRIVEDIESIRAVHHGRDLQISLDLRIQGSTQKHLADAVGETRAVGASAVMLDVATGEVLAMANVPDYNPNNRSSSGMEILRNKSVTDVFEPGSTIKPFTLAMALASGHFSTETPIPTGPGVYRIGKHQISDIKDYGVLSFSGVLVKSSNVGTVKIALELAPEELYRTLSAVGFGEVSGVELPGEVDGSLVKRERWRPIEHATLSYGYGLASTQVQLARAYSVLASGGILRPVTLRHRSASVPGQRVLSKPTVQQINMLLEKVVSAEGTANKAAVPAYRVAGKTGTVHKPSSSGGYDEDRYQSIFVGFAPVSKPRFVLAVMVDEPQGKYFGGEVAAPVFARIMSDALRFNGIKPDASTASGITIVAHPVETEAGA
ncbi:peptidoglycan D,D-transpeptidase FtsI family protein [Arenicellales bacterium nBUS_45]